MFRRGGAEGTAVMARIARARCRVHRSSATASGLCRCWPGRSARAWRRGGGQDAARVVLAECSAGVPLDLIDLEIREQLQLAAVSGLLAVSTWSPRP